SLGLLTINALTASSGVIVPVQCEYLSLRGLVQLENTMTMIRENLNPAVKIIGILPTMFDGRTLHSREAIEILQENFGDLVFDTRIRKTIRFAEAPVKGSSVLKYDPGGPAADAYRRGGRGGQKAAKARRPPRGAARGAVKGDGAPPGAAPKARGRPRPCAREAGSAAEKGRGRARPPAGGAARAGSPPASST